MRLTNKMGISYDVEDFTNCYEAIDKLGKLEDILEKYNLDTPELLELDLKYSHKFSHEYGQIEEELGVNLLTLIKALKDGVYYRFNQKDKLTKMKKPMLRVIDNKLCLIAPKWITTTWMNVKLKDYGVTWALTKEELI